MRFRLQYSILSLLLVTTACAVVIAYVVVPWRHKVRQEEIISRLKSHKEYQPYFNFESKTNSYTFLHWTNPKSLQFFIDNMEDCDRISTIEFENECFNDQQLAKLLQLQRLDRLKLERCAINENRMNILCGLPLQELRFHSLASLSFSTWPIQPRLESLILSYSPAHPAPPLQLVSHPRLRVLEIDSCPTNMTIDSCRELTDLRLSPPAEKTSTTIHLKNLPRLKSLSLSFDANVTNFQHEEFPALQRLSINAELFQYFQNDQFQNLKEFSCENFNSLTSAELLKILKLPQLEKLFLRPNWPESVKSDMSIPRLSRLQELNLVAGSSREGKILVPEELASRFVRQSSALESLKLALKNASNELLVEISKLQELRELSLDVQGDIGDLSVLNNCKKLKQLELTFLDLPQARIADFNKLTLVERLILRHRGITDIDMSTLQSRPKFAAHYNFELHTTNFPIMLPPHKVKVPVYK